MKICILGRSNYKLLKRKLEIFKEEGHEVFVITLHGGDESEGITYHHIKTAGPGFFRYFLAIPRMLKILQSIQPDVVDAQGITSYSIWTLFINKIPKVATVYGPDMYMQASKNFLLKKLAAKILNNADVVFGSSPSIGGYIKEHIGINVDEKLKIKSWGIPFQTITENGEERRKEKRQEFKVSPETKVILHCRRFMEFWRVPTIIESIPKVVAHNPNVEYWFVYPPLVASEQKLMDEMQEKVKSYEVEKNVRFLGGFDYKDFISVMHASDIFVCIGKDDLLASTLLEALSTGLIPVLSDVKSYDEVITHNENGYLLSDVSVDGVSDQLNLILKDFQKIKTAFTTINEKLMADNYDEVNCTRWLLQQYQELINTSALAEIS